MLIIKKNNQKCAYEIPRNIFIKKGEIKGFYGNQTNPVMNDIQIS